MRAAYPDLEGTVTRDGATIAFEVYERAGAPTLLLTQSWQIIHARHWKFMIPYLSRHYRVVTYDPVGNGKSDRIFDRERYGNRSYLDDALAVLDGTGTSTAIAVGLSRGGGIATMLGAFHPDRFDGVVAIAPTHPWVVPHPGRGAIYAGMFDRVEDPGVGEVQRPLLARELGRLRRVLLRRVLLGSTLDEVVGRHHGVGVGDRR